MARMIKDKGTTKRRISHKAIAKALGAEDAKIEMDERQGPISLLSLRQFLVGRLRSTGGRPKLQGTGKKRNKIPLFDEDEKKLEAIAKYFRKSKKINVSSGQIASALIHKGISKIKWTGVLLKKSKKRHLEEFLADL